MTTELHAIIKVSAEALAALLQLPQGAYIEGVRSTNELRVLDLHVRGAGWPVKPGETIRTAETATAESRKAKSGELITTIDWKLT